jgi:DNA repair exonuclease SbcCD ATPase subunit
MNFNRLRIVNFLTIGDSGDLLLANRGLNLIQGQNDDDPSAASNGAGKSSVPDALCWVLFGTTARGEQGDAVINVGAKKGTRVEVEIQDGSTVYRISRSRKPNALELSAQPAGGTPVMLTKGTERETQAEIEKVLGCSYEVFMAAIYAGQEQMPDLPAMTDKSLKLLIEEAAGVQKLERAYEAARAKENQTRTQIEANSTALAQHEQRLHSTKVNLEGAKLKHAEFEQGREQRAAAFESQAAADKQQAEHLIGSLAGTDEAAVRAQLEATQAQLASIATAQRTVATFSSQQVLTASRAEATAKTLYEQALKQAQQIRATLDNAAVEMAKPCVTCGKPHTPDELEQFKEHTTVRLREAAANAQTLADSYTAAQAARAKVGEQYQALLAAVPDATELNNAARNFQSVIENIVRVRGEAHRLIEKIKAQRQQAQDARTQANPEQSKIDMLNGQIAELEVQVDALKEGKDHLARVLEVAQVVTKVFGPAGVRAHILDTVTPFLNDRTAEYLSTLSDGNITAVWSTLSRTGKGELREKFVIEVENATGAKSFKGLSGGEKRKVRIATMMALQDLVASRASKPLNLWIGDEVDDALDAAGLERLMVILERKAREKGTVLVISHNELRDWIDAVTVVRKQGGKSSIEGALSVA